jgi:malonyl-CoA O-methyltransferase
MTISLDQALPDKRAARRSFDRATAFDTACFVHDVARERLLERLEFLGQAPRTIVDLGCGTGRDAAALRALYPEARLLALDSSRGMLRATAARSDLGATVVGGDAERLPFGAQSVDLLFASLVLPWCRPDRVFAEAARVLTDGGVLAFATLGPDSLAEIRSAFAATDNAIHVHAAFDMHDLGDWILAAGLAEPVLDVDRLTVTYAAPAALWRDLKAVGACNVAGARRRALTGRRRWADMEHALAGRPERFTVTVELIFGQAFGRGSGAVQRSGGAAREFAVPVERIGRIAENT